MIYRALPKLPFPYLEVRGRRFHSTVPAWLAMPQKSFLGLVLKCHSARNPLQCYHWHCVSSVMSHFLYRQPFHLNVSYWPGSSIYSNEKAYWALLYASGRFWAHKAGTHRSTAQLHTTHLIVTSTSYQKEILTKIGGELGAKKHPQGSSMVLKTAAGAKYKVLASNDRRSVDWSIRWAA